jgi:hypothetical protein
MAKQNDELNYEARLFYSGKKNGEDFDFHGDSAALADDHVRHMMDSEEKLESVHFRKKGNKRWIILAKPKSIYEESFFWEQEAMKNRKACGDLLRSNKELTDICSTVIATMVLEKAGRSDIAERLKKAVLKATTLNKKIILQ